MSSLLVVLVDFLSMNYERLAANDQLLQIKLHQMLKICGQFLFGKSGEKFRLGAFVDFTNAVYQFSFGHLCTPSKSKE